MALSDIFGDAVGDIREFHSEAADRPDVQKLVLLMEAMDVVLMTEGIVDTPYSPYDSEWTARYLATRSALDQLDVSQVKESLSRLRQHVCEMRASEPNSIGTDLEAKRRNGSGNVMRSASMEPMPDDAVPIDRLGETSRGQLFNTAVNAILQLVDGPVEFEFNGQNLFERCDGWVRHALGQLEDEIEAFLAGDAEDN